MGLFDSIAGKVSRSVTSSVSNSVQSAINKTKSGIENKAESTFKGAASRIGNKSEKIVFSSLPETLEQFASLPQAQMKTPFDTAAMTVLAFCYYPKDRELAFSMLNYLRGPRPMNGMDRSFIADRFLDKDYVPRSYFDGATPQNDYQPSIPYAIKVSENPYSYEQENMAKLFVTSGGADSPRDVQLRLAKDGKWYLWESPGLLSGIRQPESSNPWA